MEATRICPHCGKPHRLTARFCPVTGKLVQLEQTPQGLTSAAGPQNAPAQAVEALPEAGLTGRLPANSFLNQRYLILKKIGQGGMAAVYLASDTQQVSRAWAVKEMSEAAIPNPQERQAAVQAFYQEADLLRRLDHPNLPKVIDVFSEGGKQYLVMEFVPGASLEAMLGSRQLPFLETEVRQWALQLCDVLAYLHGQIPPLIFRDLKPSNIMITPQGQVKLIDFGIVRFFKPGKARDTVALGTPGYAAPEALSGQTDERSDLYSLCVTLHQLLTGHDPATTIFNLPPVRECNPAVSAQMAALVERGLQKKREQRFQNALDLRQALLWMDQGIPAGGSMHPTMVIAGGLPAAAPGAWQASPQPAFIPAPAPDAIQEPAHSPAPARPASPRPGGSARPSRPTTRLVMAAARLSAGQLALLIAGIVVALVALTWLLSPALSRSSIVWNNVPLMALFGAFGYAALPRRGVTFLTHVLLTAALVITIWVRVSDQSYSWLDLLLGLVVSGAVMEAWVFFLPRLKARQTKDSWLLEAAWLAFMEVLGVAVFMLIVTQGKFGLTPMIWVLSAMFGLLGWFLGDLIQQFYVEKQKRLLR